MSPGSTGDPGPSGEEDGRVKGNEQAHTHSLVEHKQNQAMLGSNFLSCWDAVGVFRAYGQRVFIRAALVSHSFTSTVHGS